MIDTATSPAAVHRKPLEAEWPEADLEHLGKCPVCGGAERSIEYAGLQDKIFFCAPGVWTSWRCGSCDVVYLDPRPTQSSIGRAYESYYTHDSGGASFVPKSGLLQGLRQVVRNSYLNKTFGYRLRPALQCAALVLEMQPARALSTSHFYRHLPAPRNKDDCLLDIGCGNGHFLQIARDQLKYKVEGLEIDPRAIANARSRGLTIHEGSIPGTSLKPGGFFQVTLSHVLEHLHNPVAALQEIFALLKPGGRTWISVPNIAAASLDRFGSNSRLLEPPRHLVMFDPDSLRRILQKVGFADVTLLPQADSNFFVYSQSWMMENGLDPYASSDQIIPIQQRRVAEVGARSLTSKNVDIFTMTGRRQ